MINIHFKNKEFLSRGCILLVDDHTEPYIGVMPIISYNLPAHLARVINKCLDRYTNTIYKTTFDLISFLTSLLFYDTVVLLKIYNNTYMLQVYFKEEDQTPELIYEQVLTPAITIGDIRCLEDLLKNILIR